MLSDRGHTELPGTLPETQCDGQGCVKYNFVFLSFCGCGVVCGTFLYLTNIIFPMYNFQNLGYINYNFEFFKFLSFSRV